MKRTKSFLLSCVKPRNDQVKLIKAESFIRFRLMIYETCMHQTQKRLIIHVFSHCTGDLLQFIESDEAFFFGVVKSKNSLKAILCLVLSDF
jgi:hypothetical protein